VQWHVHDMTPRRIFAADRDADHTGPNKMSRTRALVPSDAEYHEGISAPRPSAPFLAQLLAVKFDFPQARRRRKSSADDVAAVYRDQASWDSWGRLHRICRDL
jgi:hypothetical protein